jgi:hypothetical protein
MGLWGRLPEVDWKTWLTAASVVVAFVALLFGPGLLRREPKAQVHISTIDMEMRVPAQMQLLMQNLLATILTDEDRFALWETLRSEMVGMGLTEKRVRQILIDRDKLKGRTSTKLERDNVKLSPREENIERLALSKALGGILSSYNKRLAQDMMPPERLLIVTIDNDSDGEAKNFTIKIETQGELAGYVVEATNEVSKELRDGEVVIIRSPRLSAHERLRVYAWRRWQGGSNSKNPVIGCAWDGGSARAESSSAVSMYQK